MTRARLLQTTAATFAALALAACGGTEAETYADADTDSATYAVTETPNQAVMGAVERSDADFTADYDSAADYDLAENRMDEDMDLDLDDDDDLEDLDDRDDDIEFYRDVDDYSVYRK